MSDNIFDTNSKYYEYYKIPNSFDDKIRYFIESYKLDGENIDLLKEICLQIATNAIYKYNKNSDKFKEEDVETAINILTETLYNADIIDKNKVKHIIKKQLV